MTPCRTPRTGNDAKAWATARLAVAGRHGPSVSHYTYLIATCLPKRVPMDLTKKIGQRLRAARQAQGLSLSDLSGRTGSLSKSRISNYEQGIRRMGLEEAQELALALGSVTATYLLCLDDKDPLSEEERCLLERYRDSDPRGRETILKVAEGQAVYRADKPPRPADGEANEGGAAGG